MGLLVDETTMTTTTMTGIEGIERIETHFYDLLHLHSKNQDGINSTGGCQQLFSTCFFVSNVKDIRYLKMIQTIRTSRASNSVYNISSFTATLCNK